MGNESNFQRYSPLWFYQQSLWQTTHSPAPRRWISPSRGDHWWPTRSNIRHLKITQKRNIPGAPLWHYIYKQRGKLKLRLFVCTRNSFHGGCHCGLGMVGAFLAIAFLVPPPSKRDWNKYINSLSDQISQWFYSTGKQSRYLIKRKQCDLPQKKTEGEISLLLLRVDGCHQHWKRCGWRPA